MTPGKPAILYEGGEFSYAALAHRIDIYAQVLGLGLGLQRGDRVAYLGLNSPEFITLLFACARVGAVLLPLNWRLTAPEHAQILQHARPLVLFAENEFTDHIDSVRDQFESVAMVAFAATCENWTSFALLELASSEQATYIRPDNLTEDDGLVLCYTSGTTGAAKGALLSKKALFWNAANSIHMHEMSSEDTVLTLLPMFHVGGLNIQSMPAFYCGATVVIHRRFEVDLFYQALEEQKVTLTLLVPTVLLALMSDPRWETCRPNHLRLISIGSTIVPAQLVLAVCDWGVPLIQVYGSTETGPIAAYTPAADAARKPASTGKTAAHCEIRLVDEQGDEVAVDEKGEILVRGPNVMTEYWADVEATREAFTDHWFHSGDVGHFDAEGFLYVDGRIKDMIISGGENIYPAQIENHLTACDEIDEVAVVGRADDYWGEVAVAVVVAKKGCSINAEQVLAYCEGRISSYSCPKEVIMVDHLPCNAMGKVLKEELRKLVIVRMKSAQGRGRSKNQI